LGRPRATSPAKDGTSASRPQVTPANNDASGVDPRLDSLQAVWQSFDRFQAVLSAEAVELLSKAFNLSAVPS
jgi:hypothetical protein